MTILTILPLLQLPIGIILAIALIVNHIRFEIKQRKIDKEMDKIMEKYRK